MAMVTSLGSDLLIELLPISGLLDFILTRATEEADARCRMQPHLRVCGCEKRCGRLSARRKKRDSKCHAKEADHVLKPRQPNNMRGRSRRRVALRGGYSGGSRRSIKANRLAAKKNRRGFRRNSIKGKIRPSDELSKFDGCQMARKRAAITAALRVARTASGLILRV
jgi:hypothetical protein